MNSISSKIMSLIICGLTSQEHFWDPFIGHFFEFLCKCLKRIIDFRIWRMKMFIHYLDSSFKSDSDHVFDNFSQKWVTHLNHEYRVSLGPYLYFQLTIVLGKGGTESVRLDIRFSTPTKVSSNPFQKCTITCLLT